MKKNILIVGGTSGVGSELAKHYVSEGHNVCVTGRKDPGLEGATYEKLAITDASEILAGDIDRVLGQFEKIHTLIYAAGFLQRGHIDQLTDHDLRIMTNVGLLAPMMLIQRLKQDAPTPLKVMLITSSSQYTPREHEPAYCATKSGLGMLGASLAQDPQIGKVLVAAPAGIRTPFWDGTGKDMQTMLDPGWVAQQIVDLSSGAFKYKYSKILRAPALTEIIECLDNDLNVALGHV